MKKFFSTILIVLFSFIAVIARSYKVEDIPNVHLQDRTRFISNPDGIITPAAQNSLDSLMSRLRRSTSAEMVAVVVEDIDGADIDTYANELFNLWGLGKKDNNNGVLLLVARDSRKAVIRTGPGVEGVLTDAACGRILRNEMFPAFREGDYDGGTLAAVNAVAARLGDPEAAEEIRSREKDADFDDYSASDFLTGYLKISAMLTLVLGGVVLFKIISLRKKSPYDKYTAFENWRAPMLIASFGGLGIPLLVTIPLLLTMRFWRNRPRKCPNCGHKMVKIDEVHDNDFLTPAQDCEERIGSVDYDVWHCSNCGETDIFPFVNKSMPLVECDNCHARTAKLTGDRIIIQPTTSRAGLGQKEFTCLNCHHKMGKNYTIAKLAPVIIAPINGGGRGGFGGGGGTFGGGFGGGFTGGGGASGGW
ncbi:MAG: TPM domain-containing protein [Muribaculaceae bacterium]|nr:TPM domain-containing protein [Muribaculaceae bacterium]